MVVEGIMDFVKEYIQMEIPTLIGIAGWSVATVSALATIMTIVIAGFGIYFQKSLSKTAKNEIIAKAKKELDKALKDPIILENFIKLVVESENFKNRFSDFINIEVNNALESRETLNNSKYEIDNLNTKNRDSDGRIKEIFGEKE